MEIKMPRQLMPTGTLKKRAEAYKKINTAILLGSLECEELTDVEVVTLNQYATDCAYRSVLDEQHNTSSYEDVQVQVENLLNTSFKEAHEFISIEHNRVVIGVDAERVDDRAVDKALLLLVEIEDFSEGAHHTFGEPIALNAKP